MGIMKCLLPRPGKFRSFGQGDEGLGKSGKFHAVADGSSAERDSNTRTKNNSRNNNEKQTKQKSGGRREKKKWRRKGHGW